MSKTIDEKVVEMKFDNRHFESNVKTTMSTLDKLKQRLSFKGATKGLDEIGNSARKCDLSPISKGVEAVQVKFSAMQVASMTAIANITSSAVNAGKRIARAFTIEPVSTGFSEYELKMGSVQTIMASTGASLSEVNEYLDQLNEYSDKTIYSFSDMTNSIGKFTNAGVNLKQAVTAIQGVSNVAAVSGANANEASRAMYNFAQALSAGYVKLIDWKSIENANMATVEFKQQLIDTATAMGTLTKTADGYKTKGNTLITATKNFNDSLQDQWMTTDVLITTLGKYADETTDIGKKAFSSAQDVKTFSMMMDTLKEAAQSGWAQTWEIIIGDFEEAKQLWTNLSSIFGNIIETSSKIRNDFLKKILGGGDNGKSWEKIEKKVKKAGISVDDFKKKLVKTADAHNLNVSKMIKKTGSFEESLKKGWLTPKIVSETIGSLIKETDKYTKSADDMSSKLRYFQKIVDDVWHGGYKNGKERIAALTKAGYKYSDVQKLVNKTVDGHRLTLADLSDVQLKAVGYTNKEIDALHKLKKQAEDSGSSLNQLIDNTDKLSGREMIVRSFSNIFEQFGKIINAIKESFSEVFGETDIENPIKGAIEKFYEWSTSIEVTNTAIQNITDTMTGFLNGIKLILMFQGGIFKFVNTLFTRLLNILQLDLTGFTARIGQMLNELYNWVMSNNEVMTYLVDTGNKILDWIENSVTSIRTWITEFLKTKDVQEIIENLKKSFFDTFNNLKEWIKGFGPIFEDFISKIKSVKDLSLKDIWKSVTDFGSKIIDHVLTIGDSFSNLFAQIEIFRNKIVEHFTGMSGGASEAWNTVKSVLEKYYNFLVDIKDKLKANFGFSEIFAVLMGVGVITIGLKLLKIIDSLNKKLFRLSDGLRGVFDAVKSMTAEYAKARKLEAVGTAIKSIATAILILAVAFFILSKVDPNQVGQATTIMIITIAGLAAAAFALSKLGEISVELYAGTAAILSLAVALGILVASIKILEGTNPVETFVNLCLIVLGMISLATVVGVLSKLVPELSASSVSLIAMAGSLLIMVKAIKILNGLDPMQTAGSLFTIVILLSVMSVLAKIIGSTEKSIGRAALALVGMSVSMVLMAAAIKLLAMLKTSEISKAIATMTGISVVFALIIAATKFAGKHAAQAAVVMVGFVAAVMMMVGAIKLINTLSKYELQKALDAIWQIKDIFAMLIAISFLAGKHSAQSGALLVAASGSMLLVATAVIALSHVSQANLEKAMNVIGWIGVIFDSMLVASSVSKFDKDSYKSLVAMIVGMGVLIVAVGALSAVPAEDLYRAVGAVSIVMLAFAGLIASTSKIADISGKKIGMFVTLMIFVGYLVGIVYALSMIPAEASLKNVASLSILLLSLSLALVVVSKAGALAESAVKNLYLISGVILILGGILTAMAKFNAEASLQSASAISLVLLAMSAVLIILAHVGPSALKAMGSIYALSGVVFILAIILGAMAALNVEPSLETAKAISTLVLALSGACVILTAVGLFAISALQGVGVLSALIVALGGLMLLFGGLNSAIPELEKFLDSGIAVLTKIGEAIGSFIGGIVAGFTSVSLDGLDVFVENLNNFMNDIQPFLDASRLISEESLAGVDMLANILDTLSGISSNADSMTLSDFGSQLEPFAESIKKYAELVSEIKPESISAIKNSAEAAKAIVEVANNIPNSGGLLGALAGENDIDSFGTKMKTFGYAIKNYSDTVSTITPEAFSAIKKSASAAKALTEVANNIPSSGGFINAIAGEKDISTFGIKLKTYGYSLKQYADLVSTFKPETVDAIKNSAKATKEINKVIKEIPSSGGWAQSIFGSQDASDFGTKLESFGLSLQKYSTAVSNISLEKIQNATKAVKSINKAVNSTKDIDTSGVSNFQTAIDKIARTQVSSFTNSFSGVSNKINATGNNMMNSLASGISSNTTAVTSAMSRTMSSAVTAAEKSLSNIKTVAKTACNSAASAILNSDKQFKSVGLHLGNGLIIGLNEKKRQTYLAGYALGRKAAQGTKDGAAVESPSKLTMSVGRYIGEGLIVGINSMDSAVYKTGESLGRQAAESVSYALNMLSSIDENDLVSHPTIRPVVDLSNVQNSSNAINSMLDGMSLGVDSNLKAINMFMHQKNQNGVNDDVVSALDTLGRKLDNLERPSYNINGITYDDGSNVANAIGDIVRAARIERRV